MSVTLTSKAAISFQSLRLVARPSALTLRRALATLPGTDIYVHDQEPSNRSTRRSLLSLLPDTPPNTSLVLGTTTKIPPTPDSFVVNHDFLDVLQWVIKDNAAQDPDVRAQAQVYASQSGSALGSGGVFFPQQQQRRRERTNRQPGVGGSGGGGAGGDGAGGASAQGGMGGAGRGGYIHVSDQRNPPDYGRVAWPEDIFGSVELDGQGQFVDGHGRYQASNTYRVVTNEGILGLSPFLKRKLVEKLKELDTQARTNG